MEIFGIYVNKIRAKATEKALEAIKLLTDKGFKCIVESDIFKIVPEEFKSNIIEKNLFGICKNADVVLSFGGDGTLLNVARETLNNEIPIMGFNVGKLGFLAEYNVDFLEEHINSLLKGDFRLVDRSVIETTLNSEKIYALNDFVIEKTNTSKMITVRTFSDEHFVGDYRADGLILTSPTGSTAYNLSCMGPIIAPSAKVLCITPISPHTLTIRPLVVPDSNEITFQLIEAPEGASLVADGQTITKLKEMDKIQFKVSNLKIKLIKPKKSSFYDVLRNKFLWATSNIEF